MTHPGRPATGVPSSKYPRQNIAPGRSFAPQLVQKGGVIRDLEWKPTIVTKAKQYQRDIIPAYFEGKNSNFFYNLARFRKKIGIKFNIEMLYLVDEMYRQKGNTLRVTFGEPISYHTFTDEKDNKEWAAWLKEQTYSLNRK